MKYIAHDGYWDGDAWCVSVEDGPQIIRSLNPRLDLANHSPTGFAWGYGGSGPAQLALAILADATGDDEKALRLYQRYKFDIIAMMDGHEGFEIAKADVLAWVEANDGA